MVLDFENPALQFNITRLRDRNCTGEDFVHYAVRTFSLLLDFALCELIDEDEEVVVETASGVPVVGSDFPEPKPLFSGISIQRNFKHADALARDVLSNGLPPGTVFGSIRLAEKGLKLAKIESSTLPSDLEDRHAILLDPEFSSLDSIETAIRVSIYVPDITSLFHYPSCSFYWPMVFLKVKFSCSVSSRRRMSPMRFVKPFHKLNLLSFRLMNKWMNRVRLSLDWVDFITDTKPQRNCRANLPCSVSFNDHFNFSQSKHFIFQFYF